MLRFLSQQWHKSGFGTHATIYFIREFKCDCTGRAPSATFNTPTPFPIMSAIEIWDNILKDNVEKDDPLWQEYVDKAAVFDEHMVDEWNKIVDVLLVYVGYFLLLPE